jgi:hypothetical protein
LRTTIAAFLSRSASSTFAAAFALSRVPCRTAVIGSSSWDAASSWYLAASRSSLAGPASNGVRSTAPIRRSNEASARSCRALGNRVSSIATSARSSNPIADSSSELSAGHISSRRRQQWGHRAAPWRCRHASTASC